MLGDKKFVKDILDRLKEDKKLLKEGLINTKGYETAEWEGIIEGLENSIIIILSKAKNWYGFTEEDIEQE
jgi:hypothetical protein